MPSEPTTSEPTTTDVAITPLMPDASASLTGLLGRPAGDGPWPGVVMVHEAFGVTDVMRRQVERLTSAGYLVLMPDLFTEGGPRKCLFETFRALSDGEGRAFADIDSARSYLASRDDCTGHIGILGFCMGGGFALQSTGRGFGAASSNYGRLPGHLDETLRGGCPVIGSYGAKDLSLVLAAKKLDESLTRVKVPHDVKEYPDAGHSFLNDAPTGPPLMRPLMQKVLGAGPNPEAAADAWARIEVFFAEHLADTRS